MRRGTVTRTGTRRAAFACTYVHANAARRVPVRVTVPRRIAHPRPRTEVVEVAGRKGEVDCLLDLSGVVRPERGAVERLPRPPRKAAPPIGHSQQLLHLDDQVVARAQADSPDRDGDDGSAFRRDGDARLRSVAPRLDPRVDREHEASTEHDEAHVENASLLGRVLPQAERGNRAEKHCQGGAAERGETRDRMVPSHSPDEVARDRKGGQESAQCRKRSEEESCGALCVLPDREEPWPRLDATPQSLRNPQESLRNLEVASVPWSSEHTPTSTPSSTLPVRCCFVTRPGTT